jgi:hypothetical protein
MSTSGVARWVVRPSDGTTAGRDDLPVAGPSLPPPGRPLPPPRPGSAPIPPTGEVVPPKQRYMAHAPSTTPRAEATSDAWFWVAIGAAVAAIVGAFLPWISASAPFVGTITRSGIDGGGDGTITAAIGVGIAAIALTFRHKIGQAGAWIGLLLCSAIILFVSVRDFSDVNNRIKDIDSQYVTASVGAGLYLTIAAGIAGVVAALMRRSQRQ